MSTKEEEEHKELVRREPIGGGQAAVAGNMPPAGDIAVQRVAPSPLERKEVVEKRTSTNTGAMVAIAIGIIVLAAGIVLVYSAIPFLPWPYSIIVVLAFGLILIAIGASFISSRTSTIAA